MRLSALLLVLCVFCDVSIGNDESNSGDVTAAKRSDDVSLDALQAVVQQQSAQLQTVLAEMAAMKTELATTKSLVQQLRQRVAFTAYFTEGGAIDIGQSSPIPFNHVTLNLGQGYDTHTGVFTAPVSGVYLFVLNAKATGVDGTIYLDIVQGNTVVYKEALHSEALHFARATASVTLHVSAGERVFVRHENGATSIDRWYDTAFSGILLYADQ